MPGTSPEAGPFSHLKAELKPSHVVSPVALGQNRPLKPQKFELRWSLFCLKTQEETSFTLYIRLSNLVLAKLEGPREAQVSILLMETETQRKQKKDFLFGDRLEPQPMKLSHFLGGNTLEQNATSVLFFFFLQKMSQEQGMRLLCDNYLQHAPGLLGGCGEGLRMW